MAETYEDIIEEIERLDSSSENYSRYIQNHGLKKRHQWASTDMALDIAARVRDAVAGQPSEWWVADADGNHVHIGDKVTNSYNCTFEVVGLGVLNGRKTVEYDDGDFCFADTVRKFSTQDTREKIINDAIEELMSAAADSKVSINETLSKAVDRAMKLPKVEQ